MLIPEPIDQGGGVVAQIRQGNAEKAILAGLQRLTAMGLHGTDGKTSPRFLPRLLHEYKLAEGHSKAELADAMRSLMLDNRLRRAPVGRDDHRRAVFGLEAV